MQIEIEAVHSETGDRRTLGTCMTDSPGRAIQMYQGKLREAEYIEWDYIEEEKNERTCKFMG